MIAVVVVVAAVNAEVISLLWPYTDVSRYALVESIREVVIVIFNI